MNGTTDYKITDKMALTVIGGYRTYETTWSNDSDQTPFELQQTTRCSSIASSRAKLDSAACCFDDRLDWTAGVFYYNSHSRIYNTANFPTFGLKFTTDDLYSTENKSAFAHVNYKFTDRFSVSGGLRYSDESKSNFFRHVGQFEFPRAAGVRQQPRELQGRGRLPGHGKLLRVRLRFRRLHLRGRHAAHLHRRAAAGARG